MAITITVTGGREVEKSLQRILGRYPEAVAAALYQEGLALDAEAAKRMPVDTGRMRASRYTAPPEQTSSGPVVEVGVGVEYAIYVHERTEARHPVGEAKFLENALRERASGFAARLAARIKQNAERGVGVTALPVK